MSSSPRCGNRHRAPATGRDARRGVPTWSFRRARGQAVAASLVAARPDPTAAALLGRRLHGALRAKERDEPLDEAPHVLGNDNASEDDAAAEQPCHVPSRAGDPLPSPSNALLARARCPCRRARTRARRHTALQSVHRFFSHLVGLRSISRPRGWPRVVAASAMPPTDRSLTTSLAFRRGSQSGGNLLVEVPDDLLEGRVPALRDGLAASGLPGSTGVRGRGALVDLVEQDPR